MADYDNDSITLTTKPVDFDDLGIIDYNDINMLFYYELRSTKNENFYRV